MARYTHVSRKIRRAKKGKQTRWAPFWAVLKKHGTQKRTHPARITHVKRSWRRQRMKL